jgi:monovalent cation/hydrogen antiporter
MAEPVVPEWNHCGVDVALSILGIVATVLVVTAVADRLDFSAPLLLIVVGIGASFIPGLTPPELTPELVLLGLLPPLLYATAIRTSVIDFRANKRAILSLSVVLVVVTALGVGLITWWLLPVDFAVAFALGAVVAPPDAVAATSIARRVGLPRQLVTILEGESLVNDATAITCLRVAIAAIGGAVSAAEVTGGFLIAAGGGAITGLALALVVVPIRRRITQPVFDTAISLVVPFAAYVPAELIHVGDFHGSGVIAVVTAGLILGHESPVIQSGQSRLSERVNWATIQFLLENTVFLLIGLQTRWILDDLSQSPLPTSTIAIATVGVFAAVVLLRPLWVFPTTYLSRKIVGRSRPGPITWQSLAVVSWAGMRGVVTLAAVFILPEDTPHREVLVFIALAVTAGTLLLQGSTLPWLVRRMGLPGPDPAEDALQEAAVLQGAHRAAEEELERIINPDDPEEVVALLRQRGEARALAAWERLGRPESEYETPSEAYRRLRTAMLQTERAHILKVRDEGLVADEVLQRAQIALDIEESILDRSASDDVGGQSDDLRVPPPPGGECGHLAEAPLVLTPNTPEGCEECLRDGTSWVHLRLCLECGHVGCCDSSPERHASKHFGTTEHPVMRSFEPGENWRWCFVDEKLG